MKNDIYIAYIAKRSQPPALGLWMLLSLALHAIVAAWLLQGDLVILVSPVAHHAPVEPVSIRLVSAPAPSVPAPTETIEPVVEKPPVEPELVNPPVEPEIARPIPEPRAAARPLREPEPVVAVTPPPPLLAATADPARADPQPAPIRAATTEPVDVAAAPADRPSEPDARQLWVEQVRSEILAQKRYPALARRRDIEGIVEAHVSIDEHGHLAALRIVDGAPRVLARATEKAVRKAAPFPAPPFGATIIQLPIDYALVR